MIDLVQRLRFDAARCESQFSKGVAANIEEAATEIERLRAALVTEFERGKDVGRAIGWDAAKRDTAKLLGLDGPS